MRSSPTSKSTSAEPSNTGPGILFPPPLLLAGGILLGWILETRVRALALTADAALSTSLEIVGVLLLATGLAFAFWGIWTFVRARTAIIPHRPASRLVVSGPYEHSRNPMYLGLTTAYLGLSLVMNSGWPILLLPVAMFALYVLVIRREERYLTEEFGGDYRAYQQRVRRWL